MSVSTWIQQPATKQEIKHRFQSFLKTFLNDEYRPVYSERITSMAQNNGMSLIIDYEHLVATEQVLAYFVPEAPKEMLDIFDEARFIFVL